jgi:hypothetical protein
MFVGFTVIFPVSLLDMAMKTPPAGATSARLTGITADCPGPTTTPLASEISAAFSK